MSLLVCSFECSGNMAARREGCHDGHISPRVAQIQETLGSDLVRAKSLVDKNEL